MGIWGTGPLDNDDAADWHGELVDEPSLQSVRAALRVPKRYLDVDEGAAAIVAAEVVAQLRGHARKRDAVLPAETVAVLASHFAALKAAEVKSLARAALAAVERVADADSELEELLSERKPWLKRWTQSLADLKKRLRRPVKKQPPVRARPKKRITAPLGSIIAIPIGKKRFAFAKVYKDYTYGVYDLVRDRIVGAKQVLEHDIAFFTNGTDVAVKGGAWPIIGCEPFPDDESAWGPPMAAGQSVALLAGGYYSEDGPFAGAIEHKGGFRHCGLDEVIGLDIAGFAHRPELMVSCLVDRLIHGKHEQYRVFDPRTKR